MNNKRNKATKLGTKAGQLSCNLKSKLYWSLPWLLKNRYLKWSKSFTIREPTFIETFLAQYNGFKKVKFVSCETCGNKGLDWNSEKYGWKYEGCHIWSCPKCNIKKEKT